MLEQGVPGQVYNVGGLSERTNLQVVEAICDVLDQRRRDASAGPRRNLIQHVADRPGHDRRYAIDWYLENSGWVDRVRDGSYQGERLGLGGPA